eukprot:SAG31_NODE_1279_length_9036_cov_1.858454_1_plen_588_part_00
MARIRRVAQRIGWHDGVFAEVNPAASEPPQAREEWVARIRHTTREGLGTMPSCQLWQAAATAVFLWDAYHPHDARLEPQRTYDAQDRCMAAFPFVLPRTSPPLGRGNPRGYQPAPRAELLAATDTPICVPPTTRPDAANPTSLDAQLRAAASNAGARALRVQAGVATATEQQTPQAVPPPSIPPTPPPGDTQAWRTWASTARTSILGWLETIADALRPREVGVTIQRALESWQLPPITQLLTHPPDLYTLYRPQQPSEQGDPWQIRPRKPGDPPCALPGRISEEIVACAVMATASRFAFRCGNLAVGDSFDPDKNWSAGIVAKIASMVTTHSTDALVLPKPSTKTSHSSSAAARRLAREPVPLTHDPNNPGDLATIAFVLHWTHYSNVGPVALTQLPAFPDVCDKTGPHYGLHRAMSLQQYNALQLRLTRRHIPSWTSLLILTEYSLRIGTATAWVEAGALPGELRHLGSWATKIGEEVYARLSAERQLALQQAALHSAGTSLDSLLSAAEQSATDATAVILPGAARRTQAQNTKPPTTQEPCVPRIVPAATRPHRAPTTAASDMHHAADSSSLPAGKKRRQTPGNG